ncbi:hypothetical protein GA0115256_14497 [Streptomyces sp. DconLS]|nr:MULTISPECIES: hypothetical protein [unclassified Streptomyces]SCG02204.1 hypothetical protein GA0115256_14497 [Streptomyces sp. DconLS]
MNPEFVPSPEVLPEAFYHELGGGRYESTPATAGPWSAKSQHAGPLRPWWGTRWSGTAPGRA